MKLFSTWHKYFYLRKKYSSGGRYPFYDIVKEFLPSGEEEILVDVGCGDGEFARHLNLLKKYKNVFLLDGNAKTLNTIEDGYNKVVYKAPDELPFNNDSVSLIHCSHLIEHLSPTELYSFLKEIDRVLKINGILVVSTPMLWQRFYDDLSHVKPYNPEVLINYLVRLPKNRTTDSISSSYKMVKLIYRYRAVGADEGLQGDLMLWDFVIQIIKKILSKLRIKRYIKNGYTIVLKKTG